METLRSFSDIHEVLAGYVPAARQYREAVMSLDRMKELMTALGNPQNEYKAVHVAGSSGKTSTSYYITAMLVQAGQKVGLTVSPHIDEVNERVQVNLKPLSEKKFCKELDIFLNVLKKTGLKPTYFELLVAFAYWHFARIKVDYAVVEVGLGGLLDATNVITRRDKVSVVTDIGLDHTNLLGKTLPEITSQKAGIIQPHNAVFAYEQDSEVMDVLREVCSQLQAELHEVWPLKNGELPKNLPLYQRRNWYLALIVYDYVSKRDALPPLGETELAATTATYVPARMETITHGNKTLIMDGAHNSQKMRALAASVKKQHPKQPVAVLFSLVQSKKSRSMGTLEEVIKMADHIILTTFETQQDERKVSVGLLKMADYCEELDFHDWEIEADPLKAYKKLMKRPEKVVLITGSFYLLNHIRPLILKK